MEGRRELPPGRLPYGAPVAIVDIGSNSVRIVVYEGLSRAPAAMFNEKELCALGRSVAVTGRLSDDSVARALSALKRFRKLADVMKVGSMHVLATAAARDAANGPDFIRDAESICGSPVELLSGKREAHLSALGVLSGFFRPDGVVGDLGGGSLELVDVAKKRVGAGVTFPLGGIRLQDVSERSIKKADRIVRDALEGAASLAKLKGRAFYAVGGTWRALAHLHMVQKNYPLHVLHGYTIPVKEALEFCRLVRRVDPDTLPSVGIVSSDRRPLLAYGALVLEHIIRIGKPTEIVMSGLGVREGLLYELLDEEARREDALLVSARDLGWLRARAPRHGDDLIEWTDRLFRSVDIDETAEERRWRHAACHLADLAWRAHPDYRGEQALDVIAHAAFMGVDHPGRAFMALAIFYRHMGLLDDEASPRIRELASTRILDRARTLGGAMRIAYLVSAAVAGTLPRTPLTLKRDVLTLKLPAELGDLASDRLKNRLNRLGRLLARPTQIELV
ncbi:exopolyphosphatase [Hansschlegelia zhihuaiae]|uniref:exopolyphosphatase n=1 Tax=Hansschlegelia zhihuaiae TaxID=405005 RepID=A0A4Q0MLS5_9HYPH|nr:exopolyphosphatase [Hansschlegelia zhihuaiae]RXF74009.1 exopolyphosphatase [Hansschlegelia zhihuaiae]